MEVFNQEQLDESTQEVDYAVRDESKVPILTTGQLASLSHTKFLGSTIRSSVC